MVRALASHQCGPGSNPGVDATCVLSLLLVFSFFSQRFFPRGVLRILSDRDDRLGATIKTQKSPGLRASKRKKKFKNQIPGQKFNPKYPITNFRSNFKKALNDITRKIETLVMESLCLVVIVKTLVTLKNIFCYEKCFMDYVTLFAKLRGRDKRELSRIFTLF